jgi:hypothetical protein
MKRNRIEEVWEGIRKLGANGNSGAKLWKRSSRGGPVKPVSCSALRWSR